MGYHDGLKQDAKNHTLEVLEKYHTRQLLGVLGRVRLALVNYYLEPDSEDDKLFTNYFRRVKKVLATREHIPNKIESKKLRQLRAKQKR